MALYTSDDRKVLDLVPTLNDKIRQLFPGTQPLISVRASFHETSARGRPLPNTPPRHIYITERGPVAPRSAPIPQRATLAAVRAAAATSPPPPGSWAAAVLHGAKRLAESTTLNHRPKKNLKQRPADAHGNHAKGSSSKPPPSQGSQLPKPSSNQAPMGTSPVAAANTATAPPAADVLQSAAWKEMLARSAAIEQRLTDMAAASSSMFNNIMRNMESLTVQLDEQRRAMEGLFTQIREQTATNATFRDALASITQHLNLSAPAVPPVSAEVSSQRTVTSQPHQPAVRSTGAAGQAPSVQHPTTADMPIHTLEHSATIATPAHKGGATRNG